MIYSTVCMFSCKEGFEGNGSVVRSCTQNGTWSGTDLVCTGNYYCLVITAYSTFQFVFYNKLRLVNLLFADTNFKCYYSRPDLLGWSFNIKLRKYRRIRRLVALVQDQNIGNGNFTFHKT